MEPHRHVNPPLGDDDPLKLLHKDECRRSEHLFLRFEGQAADAVTCRVGAELTIPH